MTDLLTQVLAHQQATDTNDRTMVRLLCEFISTQSKHEHSSLIDFLQESLERGPMDVPVPAWQLPLFTDEDRETIVQLVMDEIGDASIKDLAHQHLEDEDLIECIGYAYPFEDPEHLATMLQSIIDEDYVNGEFLRFHDDDGDNLTGQVEFAKRMGLIDEAEEAVTERGREFIARFS